MLSNSSNSGTIIQINLYISRSAIDTTYRSINFQSCNSFRALLTFNQTFHRHKKSNNGECKADPWFKTSCWNISLAFWSNGVEIIQLPSSRPLHKNTPQPPTTNHPLHRNLSMSTRLLHIRDPSRSIADI